MARTTEASIWVSELKAGSLPAVCVKSGRTADAKLTFSFDQPASTGSLLAVAAFSMVLLTGPGGRRFQGPLPLTRRWRGIFLWLRAAAGIAAALGVLTFFTVGAAPPDSRSGWLGFGFGFLAACLVVLAAYGGLKPKGEVFKTPEGELWVRLRDIHPNFASAVAAMDHAVSASPPPPVD